MLISVVCWLALLSLTITGIIGFATTVYWVFGDNTTAKQGLGFWSIPVGLMSIFMCVFCILTSLAILTYKFN